MKHVQTFTNLLLVIFFTSLSLNIQGQCDCIASDFQAASWIKYRCEGFESYQAGNITPQSTQWRKWNSSSGDGIVSQYTNSTRKYLLVDGRRRSDVVFDLGLKNNTVYRTSWRMYVFDGNSAYYNIQKGNRGESSEDWAINVYFDQDGKGRVTQQSNTIGTFDFHHDSWINVMHHYNIANNVMEVWINNSLVTSFNYTWLTSNKNLGSIDFYAAPTDLYAVDNICSYEYRNIFEACPTNISPVCVAGDREYENSCYALLAGYSSLEYRHGSCDHRDPIIHCDGFQSIYSEDFEGLQGQTIVKAQPNYWSLGSHINNSPNDDIDVLVDQLTGNYSIGLDMNGGNRGNSNIVFEAGRIDNGYRSISFDLITNYDAQGNLYNGEIYLNMPYIGQLTDLPFFDIQIAFGHRNGNNYAYAYFDQYTQAGNTFTKIVDLPILDSKTNQFNPFYRLDFRINRDQNIIELFIDDQLQFEKKVPLFADRAFELEFVADFIRNGPTNMQIDNFDYGRCTPKHANAPCVDCSTCFTYSWQGNLCHFQSPSCFPDLPNANGGSPDMDTYEWSFPVGCLSRYENGTNENSANPVCRLNPGTWEICRIVYIQGEITTSYTCCITIVVQPQNCHGRPPVCHLTYSGSGLDYSLDAGTSTDADEFSWTVEDSETGLPVSINLSNRQSHNINLRSYAGRCLTFCCVVTNCYGYSRFCITICVPGGNHCQKPLPPTCGLMLPELNNDILSFRGIPTGWDSYEWYIPDAFEFTSGNQNSRSPQCRIPTTGRYIICLVIKSGCTRICICFSVGYGCCSGQNYEKIELDIGEAPCQDPGKLIRLPIRVRNFVDIRSFNFSVNLNHTRAGAIESIEGARLNGTSVNGAVISDDRATFTWSRPTSINLADHTIIGYVNVRTSNNYGEEAIVSITDDPLQVAFNQNNNVVLDALRFSGKFSVCQRKNTTLCGTVKRYDGIGIQNAQVTATDHSGLEFNEITDVNGEYCFTSLSADQEYTIMVEKNINHRNGVTSRDVALINGHLLFVNRLDNAYRVIASDATNDQNIFADDLSDILRLILGYTDEFENNQSWRFVTEEHRFSDQNNPFRVPYSEEIVLTTSSPIINNINFIGMKIGDVTLDNDPSSIAENVNQTRSIGGITLECLPIVEISDDKVAIPVAITHLDGVDNLLDIQFTMKWSGGNYKFEGIRTINSDIGIRNENFNATNVDNGSLSMAWFDLSGKGVTLNDTVILFEIIFETDPTQSTSLSLEFSDMPVQIQAGSSEEVVDVNALPKMYTFTTSSESIFEKQGVIVTPNPVSNILSIKNVDGNKIENIRMFNLSGQELNLTDIRGKDIHSIDMRPYPDGTYYFKVITDEGHSMHPVIKR